MEVFTCGAVGPGISLPEVAKVDIKPGVSLSDVTIFPCTVVTDLANHIYNAGVPFNSVSAGHLNHTHFFMLA